MTSLRRLLLVPLLAPLLAVLLLALLNPTPRLTLRLLLWRSASLPLGSWLALAAGGGAVVSAGAAGMALTQGRALRWGDRRRDASEPAAASPGPARRRDPVREPWDPASVDRGPVEPSTWPEAARASAGPERPVGEPAPTVSVPFRVIHRPSRPGEEPAAVRVAGPSAPARTPAQASAPAGGGEDWADALPEEW